MCPSQSWGPCLVYQDSTLVECPVALLFMPWDLQWWHSEVSGIHLHCERHQGSETANPHRGRHRSFNEGNLLWAGMGLVKCEAWKAGSVAAAQKDEVVLAHSF